MRQAICHVNDFMKLRGGASMSCSCRRPCTSASPCHRPSPPALPGSFWLTCAKNKADTPAETTALYGMAGTVEGKGQMTEIMNGFFDYLYSL